MEQTILVQLKFSPGTYHAIDAIAHLCSNTKENHFSLLLNEFFLKMDPSLAKNYNVKPYSRLKDAFSIKTGQGVVYLYGPSFDNLFVTFHLKKNGFYVLYHLHEPNIMDSGIPLIKRIGVSIMHFFLLRMVDEVVLSSEYAKRVYQESSGTKKQIRVVPLPFRKTVFDSSTMEKEFDCVIFGNISPDRGLDRFMEAARQMTNKKFGILSRNHKYILKNFQKDWPSNVTYIFEPIITDDRIDEFVRKARMVFLPVKRLTQSGIPPVAFANGVPIVTTDCGSMPEIIKDCWNGFLLPNKPFSIKQAIEKIETICRMPEEEYSKLAEQCTNTYLEKFDINNNKGKYSFLFE